VPVGALDGRALAASVSHEELGLGRSRVAAEEDVDLAAALAVGSEVLVRATEELQEEPLLHVVQLPDGRGEAARGVRERERGQKSVRKGWQARRGVHATTPCVGAVLVP